jgi:phage FluMu protein Com
MFDVRCPRCNSLLCKEEIRDGKLEIKCPKCNTYVDVTRVVGTVDSEKKTKYNDGITA